MAVIMRAMSHMQREAAAQRAAGQQRALHPSVRTIPAPSGGWNARDAWDEMDAQDATQLDNWFPGYGKIQVRKGSSVWASLDTTSAVETVAALNRSDGEHLIAAAGGALWDATGGGAIAASLATGFTNDRWQTANMNDKIALVNGADAPQEWDGTTLGALSITGVTASNLVGVNVFKSRSYFWENASQDFWYSAVNTLGGTLTKFPLADVGSFGGHLVAMLTWTRDGGAGMDDFAVFCMSSGEVIVYQGSDPGSASDWALVNVYRIGSLLGPRAWTKAGGDVLLGTRDGYMFLSQALPGARGARGNTVNEKIGPAVQAQIGRSGDDFGWQLFHYPRLGALFANYPFGSGFEQHVANLRTGAWCKFRGMNARCWTLFDDRPFFGAGGGQIMEADTGLDDNGAKVIADARQAPNYLGSRTANKHVRMVRPLFESSGQVMLRLGLATDFNPDPEAVVNVTLGSSAVGSAEWNTAAWNTAKWAGGVFSVSGWLPHIARGYAIAPTVRVEQSIRSVAWSATNIMYDRAGAV